MTELADRFFSELHRTHLKPAGFKKERRTFIRERPGFIERFQFQGSQWNDRNRPWVFYINAGVQFPDLPRMQPDMDFPHTHANDRIERILPMQEGFAGRWELSESNYEAMLARLPPLLEQASAVLEPLAKRIYPRCKAEGRQWLFLTRET